MLREYIFPIVIAVGVITTVSFLVLRVKKGGLPAMYCKAGASMCFIGTAFSALAFSFDSEEMMPKKQFIYGVIMILGFILSLLGDIWLDLKYCYDKDSDIFLYSGFISFMAGHVFFCSAIIYQYRLRPLHFALCFLISLALAVVIWFTEKLMKLQYGKFKKIVAVYSVFVFMTAALSVFSMAVNDFSRNTILLSIGAVAFLLSDLVLTNIYFKKGGNNNLNVVVNHTLYYFGQFALAATLLPLPLFKR
ncbi:MAG: hypothetical protein J1F24_06560 [Oscillospiraceae bacterium]|nr:hypothetical protein [Oscillospiraceae bacterium]